MLLNLKIAIRNLVKQKYFTLINITGLAISTAAAVLIYLWISHETSYDKYHQNSKNIYRITTDASIHDQEFKICLVPTALAPTYADVCPEVDKIARITNYEGNIIKYGDHLYQEDKVIRADTSFFQIFNCNFLEGNPDMPLPNKNSIVLTETLATRIFGNESAIGKSLLLNQGNLVTVSAVIEDMPSNSHNQFKAVLYFDMPDIWENFNWITYVQFIDNASVEKAQVILNEIITSHVLPVLTEGFGTTIDEFTETGNYINLNLQKLSSIHLQSGYDQELEPAGNKIYVTYFLFIAIFILVIAGINYMNMSTAYYHNRKTDVDIQKANGATPGILLRQFLFESVLVSLVAYIFSIILIQLLLPVFTGFLEIELNERLINTLKFHLFIPVFVLGLGLISSIYPVLFLALSKTSTLIGNNINTGISKSINTRSILVVVQFSVTIIVIVASLLVKQQLNYIFSKELGFNKEHVIVLEGLNLLNEQKHVFKAELEKSSGIINTSFSDSYPGESYGMITGFGIQEFGSEASVVIKTISVDSNYLNTYQMTMSQGRNFSYYDESVVILNKGATKLFGIEDNPTNYHVLFNSNSIPVIGVVNDFHHESLNSTLDPMLIMLVNTRYMNNLSIRLSGSNIAENIEYIETLWDDFTNGMPIKYNFLDDKLRASYDAVMRIGKVFVIFSILSVFIACMGVLGISSFLFQKRIKEIGVRKVNGAKTLSVIALLNKDYIKWIAVSVCIATPVAWFAMFKWLENFAYRTNISWWVFAFAGILALGIALLTVSWQSWRAASRNPVEALRYE